MKNIVISICAILVLCSCAGTRQPLDVQEHYFSFTPPPTSWKRMEVPKELIPPGGGFMAAWQKGNDSVIMIAACKHTEETKQTFKEFFRLQIYNRRFGLSHFFRVVTKSIDKESEGIFQEGVNFFHIEATIKCFKHPGKLSYKEKMYGYALSTETHFYIFSLGTVPNKFEKYVKVFEQVLNSFSYVK